MVAYGLLQEGVGVGSGGALPFFFRGWSRALAACMVGSGGTLGRVGEVMHVADYVCI